MPLSAPLVHRLFQLLAAFGILPVLLSILLLTQAQTLAARLVALIFPLFWLAAITLEICWHRGWLLDPRRRRLFQFSLFISLSLLVLLLVWIYRLTPDGRPLPGTAATQIYLNAGGYHRLSLANLVPEVDQFNFGLALLDRMGGFFPGEDSRRIRRLFQAVYHEMDQDPGFRALGSNMNYAYRELFGLPFDCGHAYVYIPALPAARSSAPASKLPVLLFLHGSLGNFKGYTWVLKELADRHPCAVVSASFGNGNWNRPGGAEAVERVRRWIAAQPQLDANRIYLAGLSNGGRGMMRAAIKTPQAYHGLISISGVLEDDLVQSRAFEAGWSGRPVLVLQGDKDARVLPERVNHAVGIMSLHGVRVTHHTWPDEDHFLLFSARYEIVALLDQWMK